MGHPQSENMDEEQMQQEILEAIKADASLLRIVHSMMRAYAVERALQEDPIVDYDEEGVPIRASQFTKEADAIVEEMKDGKFVTLDDLKEKKVTWKKTIQ